MTNPYEDIIHLPHHVSRTRPQMPMSDRAAQFSPFNALNGYSAAIQETGRLTDRKIDLEAEALKQLDEKLQFLEACMADGPEVSFTYFVADGRKTGGAYQTITGVVRKIDHVEQHIILQDRTSIPIDDILNLEGDLFSVFQ